MLCRFDWVFVIHFTVKNSPRFLFLGPSPLLEEKWHSVLATLAKDRVNPRLSQGARPKAAFTANYHPMDTAEIDRPKVFQQWLNR